MGERSPWRASAALTPSGYHYLAAIRVSHGRAAPAPADRISLSPGMIVISPIMFCQFRPHVGSARVNQGKKLLQAAVLVVSRGAAFLNIS